MLADGVDLTIVCPPSPELGSGGHELGELLDGEEEDWEEAGLR